MSDQTKYGGYYHGPSNSPGLTAREYFEMETEELNQWVRDQEELRMYLDD